MFEMSPVDCQDVEYQYSTYTYLIQLYCTVSTVLLVDSAAHTSIQNPYALHISIDTLSDANGGWLVRCNATSRSAGETQPSLGLLGRLPESLYTEKSRAECWINYPALETRYTTKASYAIFIPTLICGVVKLENGGLVMEFKEPWSRRH